MPPLLFAASQGSRWRSYALTASPFFVPSPIPHSHRRHSLRMRLLPLLLLACSLPPTLALPLRSTPGSASAKSSAAAAPSPATACDDDVPLRCCCAGNGKQACVCWRCGALRAPPRVLLMHAGSVVPKTMLACLALPSRPFLPAAPPLSPLLTASPFAQLLRCSCLAHLQLLKAKQQLSKHCCWQGGAGNGLALGLGVSDHCACVGGWEQRRQCIIYGRQVDKHN